MNEHVAAEVLAAMVDGALDAGHRPAVEAHLSRCLECREALADVLEMRRNREKIPAEFVRRALADAAAGSPGDRRFPGRAAFPARLVFGVAAVFLVAALLGYFFLNRGGMGPAPAVERALPSAAPRRPPGGLPPPVAVAREDRSPAGNAGSGKTGEEALQPSLPARKARAAQADGLKMEKKSLAEETQAGPPAPPAAGKEAAPAALPAQARQAQAAAEDEMALRRAEQGGAVGGVLGGVATPQEKDKQGAMNLAAAPAARSKGAGLEDRMSARSRLTGPGAAGDAMQLFLAATGRAAAPRSFSAPAMPSRLPLRIVGDVTLADLLDPWALDGWDWFPEEKALELTIDAAGAVMSVRLLGNWDDGDAGRAQEAAGKLAFRPSGRPTRQALLSR